FKQILHLAVVGYGSYLDVEVVVRTVVPQYLLLYSVSAVFVDIEDYYPARLVFYYLSYQLAADRAAAARYHTDLVLDISLYACVVEGYLLSSQKVADVYLLCLSYEIHVLYHLAEIGENFELTARLHTGRKYALSCLRVYRRYSEY